MTAKFACGTAAGHLAENLYEKGSITVFTRMQADISMLMTHKCLLTENVCRSWACQVAEHVLSKKNRNGFVYTLRIWLLEGEERVQECSEFDWQNAVMWQVVPTKEDELGLQEEVDPKPAAAGELREWEMARAFDKSVAGFGKLYLSAFACNSMYKYMKTELAAVQNIMEMWLISFAKGQVDHLGPLALQALETVNTLARACIACLGQAMFSKESYDDYTVVFLSSGREKAKFGSEFYQLLSLTMRKNPEWAARDFGAISPCTGLIINFIAFALLIFVRAM